MLIIKSGNPLKQKTDAIVLPVFEKKGQYKEAALNEIVDSALKMPEFSGKASEDMVIYEPKGAEAKRAILTGLGKVSDVTETTLRQMAGRVIKKAIGMKLKKVVFVLPDAKGLKAGREGAARAILEGAFLGNYIFDKYQSKKEKKTVEQIELFLEISPDAALKKLPETVEAAGKGTFFTRELVSDPSNTKRPDQFVERLKSAFEETGLNFSWLEKDELEELGCGAILAVAQGSSVPPYLAFAEYTPKTYEKTILLVGKGVTFDAGGLDLKTAAGMLDMKCDMAGAATVAGAMKAISQLKPDVRVIGVMPIVENMPSGTAYRPGDILNTYIGKTVEIGNTDAEGRLILADALAYAEERWEPDMVIDLATLTGACVMALGEKIAGVFSFNKKLADQIVKAGDVTGDRCWAMPMPADYKKLLKSEFADMNNMASSRYGGAITAALFLSEFVKTKNWAHIDIAGPAYQMKPEDYCAPGGTGFGVRLLCEFISNL